MEEDADLIVLNIDQDEEDDSSSSSEYETGREQLSPDNTGADASSSSEPSMRASDINFDLALAGTHSYLGTDMEDLSGRTFLEANTTVELPLFLRPGVVLIPGQNLPVIIYYPWEADTLLRAKTTNKTVGFLCQGNPEDPLEGSIGTTGELISMKEEDPEGEFTVLHAVVAGRQRFRALKVRRHINSIYRGTVEILPEGSEVCSQRPLDSLLPATWSRIGLPVESAVVMQDEAESDGTELVPGISRSSAVLSLVEGRPGAVWGQTDPRRPGSLQEITTGAVDKTGTPFRYTIRQPGGHCRWPERPDLRLIVGLTMTGLPPWVLLQYDVKHLMNSIRTELKQWNDTWNLSHWTVDLAVPFSYWLIQNLPVTDPIKIFLLGLDHVINRLRACLDILCKCTNFVCRVCGEAVTMKRDIVCLAREGSLQAFVNPNGYIHEMLTVSKVVNVALVGRPTSEHSWFPGYAWTIIECSSCKHHMGWRFTATNSKLKPAVFWGVCRGSVIPGFQSDPNWLPHT